MKKINWLIALLPLAGLVACTSDDEPAMPNQKTQTKQTITFAPTFDGSTRAASLYDSNTKPTEFIVGAFHIDSVGDRKPFFLGDTYQNNNGTWTNTTGTRYWPDGGSTDFYAVVTDGPDDVYWHDDVLKVSDLTAAKTRNMWTAMITQYNIDHDARNQHDILYAVAKDVHRSPNPVPLNFRHVMTQVLFDAMNVSQNIYVEISGVKINNINMQTSVNLPNKTTSASTTGDQTTYAILRGLTGSNYRSYSQATFDKVSLPGNPDETVAATPLTSADPNLAMLLTPAQSGDNSEMDPSANNYATDKSAVYPYAPNPSKPMLGKGGQSIAVNCTIWEVKDPSKGHDPAVDVELWGGKSGAPKELLIPVDISNWQPGKRITYTLMFGKGNGGINPDDDTPVLTPITYQITVDDFTDVNAKVAP